VEDFGAAVKDGAAIDARARRAAAELEGRDHGGARREAEPVLARELLHRRSRQAGETTEEHEQAPALIDGGLPADAGRAQHQGEQLRVGERARTLVEQSLARPLV